MTAYTPTPTLLSSVERIAFYLGISAGEGRVDGANNDTADQRRNRRIIIGWNQAISAGFQSYTRREFIIQERTQFFDVMARQVFFPAAVPILSVQEIVNDPLGLFQGGEWTVQTDAYHLSQTGNSLEMVWNILIPGLNTMRLKYTGGLAYDATRSTFVITADDEHNNIQPGAYAYGETSEAVGRVISIETVEGETSIVIENFYGCFLAGETLAFQPTMDGQDIPDTSAVIDSITARSLCEAYPDLSRALEIELRYMQKHEGDFENATDGGKYGATRKKQTDNPDGYRFQDETRQILDRYQRILVGS